MIPASAIAQLRYAAATDMTETWESHRLTSVFDDTTGDTVEERVKVYSGLGTLHVSTQQPNTVVEAGATVNLSQTVLALPVTVTADIRLKDLFECVGSTDDPTLIGTLVRVVGLPLGSKMTTRELVVEREVAA